VSIFFSNQEAIVVILLSRDINKSSKKPKDTFKKPQIKTNKNPKKLMNSAAIKSLSKQDKPRRKRLQDS